MTAATANFGKFLSSPGGASWPSVWQLVWQLKTCAHYNCQRTVKFIAGCMAAGPLGCYRHPGATILSAAKATETFGRESLALFIFKLVIHVASNSRPIWFDALRHRDVYSSPTARQPSSLRCQNGGEHNLITFGRESLVIYLLFSCK